ncbi:MAG: D-aminoacyl-tRNA deacylase [Planctomycetaceae bacterium]|nr:D-aminoacyl-tRNA deacylase [Planctomycetaceae bacterium]
MRACLQRVRSASVTLPQEADRVVGTIDAGLLVFLGVGVSDSESESVLLARKCAELRIFEDENGKMNRSITDVGGSMLVVSQFTLYADCRRGRRPSFTAAATPDVADRLYQHFVEEIRQRNIPVAMGAFRAEMHVSLVNDGPVTIWLDTEEW